MPDPKNKKTAATPVTVMTADVEDDPEAQARREARLVLTALVMDMEDVQSELEDREDEAQTELELDKIRRQISELKANVRMVDRKIIALKAQDASVKPPARETIEKTLLLSESVDALTIQTAETDKLFGIAGDLIAAASAALA